jgi:type I restriction enzyme, S subunit
MIHNFKLGELFEIQIGKTPARGDKKMWDLNKKSNNIWLSIRDLNQTDANGYISDSAEYITDDGAKLVKIIPKNTLLLSFKLTLGRTAITKIPLRTNEAIAALLPKTDQCDIRYLKYYFEYFNFVKFAGNDFKVKGLTLNKKKLAVIPIPVPSLQEQEKIIEKLDRSFNYISTQIENIKTQINLNSLIFESYFENVQSNFMNSGTISEFFDLATGGTPSKKNKDYFNNGNIPWLLSGDVHQENILESKNFITVDALKNSNAKYLPIGSVLIALNGQGKTRGTVAQLKINATCNQSLVSINSKDNNVIENEFLFYFLKSQYKKIRKLTGDSGNDRRGLNMKIINSMQIRFPEISVQKKIVDNCISLTEINKNLTKILDSKMNKYAELKKSLLNKELSYE